MGSARHSGRSDRHSGKYRIDNRFAGQDLLGERLLGYGMLDRVSPQCIVSRLTPS